MKAWHFLSDDGMTRYEPRQRVIVGEWLSVDPERIEMCEYGLHASLRAIDALQYAPGALICRVELGGKIITGDDKVVAERRRVIAMADATPVLHEHACQSAESVLHLIPEEQRAIARHAIDTKRRWLRGQASDSDLDAARDAAWAAVRDAAWDAAWDAANTRLERDFRALLGIGDEQ